MNDLEKNYYLERDKQYAREQNNAELERLRSQIEEMWRELEEGKLSDKAKRDLEGQIVDTNQAIRVLRDSLKALAHPDAVMVEDTTQPLTVEITNQRAYWDNEYRNKLQELDDLHKEYQLFSGSLASETASIRIRHLEADIKQVEIEAEQARENLEKLQSK